MTLSFYALLEFMFFCVEPQIYDAKNQENRAVLMRIKSSRSRPL